MNTNKSFRIKSLIGEEATCWPISPYRLSVFWESGVHEFWNPKDLEDMIAHYGWEKLEDSAQQITRIKECSANAYTASLWQISDHFYTLQWDHWVQSMTCCKEDVEDNFTKGIWTKVEAVASESLPRTFKYYFHNNPQRIYTAQPCGDKLLQVDWEDDYYGDGFQYSIEDARKYITEGSWVIIPTEPKEKIVDTLQLKIEIDGIKEAQAILDEMVEQSNTTLEAIKSFTTDSGHDVFISEGIYKVYRKGEDCPYICCTDEQVVAVMEALLMLDSVETEG